MLRSLSEPISMHATLVIAYIKTVYTFQATEETALLGEPLRLLPTSSKHGLHKQLPGTLQLVKLECVGFPCLWQKVAVHLEQWCRYRLPNLNFFWQTMHRLPSSTRDCCCCMVGRRVGCVLRSDRVSFLGDRVVLSLSEDRPPEESDCFLPRFRPNIVLGVDPLEIITSLGGLWGSGDEMRLPVELLFFEPVIPALRSYFVSSNTFPSLLLISLELFRSSDSFLFVTALE
jgi:hypothetical protein